jgi:hypothetical protein
MAGNLRMLGLNISVTHMAFSRSFLLLLLLNNVGLWSKKTEFYRKRLE